MTKEIAQGQQVQTVAQTKKKNYAIEFWRFFFAIAITGYHIGTIMPAKLLPGVLSISSWMKGAGEILFVFTLTAGYFLVKHFKRLQANPEYSSRKASGRAWEYIWDRIKALLPVLALGIILGIISVAAFKEQTFIHAVNSTINGLWEFLGLYSAGYGAAYEQANGAMWFISGLLICSYFIYWAMCKNEDVFAGIIAPAVFIFLGGWWAWNGTRASQVAWSTFGVQNASNPAVIGNPVTNAVIGFNNGLLFVLVGMCGGVLIYYAVNKLKTLNFSVTAKLCLTILYAVVATLLVVYTINPDVMNNTYNITNTTAGVGLSRWTVHLLCILLVGLTLLEKDYITQLLNNKYTGKALSYLGGSALYIYMLHMPIVYFYALIRGKNPSVPYSWLEVFLVVSAVSVVLGCVVKFLMDKFVLKKGKAKVVAAEAPVTEPSVEEKVEEVKPAKQPVAKKQVAPKAEVKKAVAKTPVKATTPAKKEETKTPVKKSVVKPAVKQAEVKAAAKKPAAKTEVKAPANKTAVKPVAKTTAAKPAAKKPVAKTTATKVAAKAPVKKTTKKTK